ncbi:MAG: hypothetical protein AAF206_19305 [Bacteroidota bacterium]
MVADRYRGQDRIGIYWWNKAQVLQRMKLIGTAASRGIINLSIELSGTETKYPARIFIMTTGTLRSRWIEVRESLTCNGYVLF